MAPAAPTSWRHDASAAGPLRWAAAVLAAAAVASLLVVGPANAQRPRLLQPGTGVAAAGFPGFDEVSLRITAGPGLPVQGRARCFVQAATPPQQAQGMRGRRSFGAFDGMAFSSPQPTSAALFAAGLVVPLSVAWFGPDGRFIAASTLAPCAEAERCPITTAPRPYATALEVREGGLPGLGLGPGAVVQLAGPCIG